MTQEEQKGEHLKNLQIYVENEKEIACIKHRFETLVRALSGLIEKSSDELLQSVCAASVKPPAEATRLEGLRYENRKVYDFLEGQGYAGGLKPPG